MKKSRKNSNNDDPEDSGDFDDKNRTTLLASDAADPKNGQNDQKTSSIQYSFQIDKSQSKNARFVKPGLLRQTAVLFNKNLKVLFGKQFFLFAHIFGAILIFGTVLFINSALSYSFTHQPPVVYPPEEVADIEKCDFSENCRSLGYILLVRFRVD